MARRDLLFAIFYLQSSILVAKWPAIRSLGEGCARGQGCTDTGDALDVVPLLVGLRERTHLRLVSFTNPPIVGRDGGPQIRFALSRGFAVSG